MRIRSALRRCITRAAVCEPRAERRAGVGGDRHCAEPRGTTLSVHAALVATAALVLALPAARAAPLAAQQPRPSTDSLRIRVLAIHDFHGALRARPWSADRHVGGAAALKAHMDSAAARCACPVFRLDSGDQMQGSLDSSLSYGEGASSR